MTYEEVKLMLDNSICVGDKYYLVETIIRKEDDGSYTLINPEDEMPPAVAEFLIKQFQETLGINVVIDDPMENLLRNKDGLYEA